MSSLHIDQDLNESPKYALAETIVGKWHNGKNIYRQVLLLTNTTSRLVSNIIEDVVEVRCFFKETSGAWRPIPWLFYNTPSALVYSWLGGFFISVAGNLTFQVGPDLGNIQKGIFVIEYTKTE